MAERKMAERRMMASLWTCHGLAQAIGASPDHFGDQSITGISIDSRTLEKGDLFFALRGPRHDGHDYVDDALERGASGVVIETAETPAPTSFLKVRDAMTALRDLAKAARRRSSAKIFAITGSVGKTSTKMALAHALAPMGQVYAGAGNLNNHIGLPLSLARLPEEAIYGVFELGSNQKGDIAPLGHLVSADIAMVTAIRDTHIGNFPDIEAIATEKGSIFQGTSQIALLPRDDVFFNRLYNQAKHSSLRHITDFGVHPDADYRLCKVIPEGFSTIAETNIAGKKMRWRIGAVGNHWAMIGTSILAMIDQAGGDVVQAANAFEGISPIAGRGAVSFLTLPKYGQITLIDESYNASPASIKAALGGLKTLSYQGRRVMVLGDMLELGKEAQKKHENLVSSILEAKIELLFTVGEFSSRLAKLMPKEIQTYSTVTADEIVPIFMEKLQSEDVVMVKGSFGSALNVVIDALKENATEYHEQDGHTSTSLEIGEDTSHA